MSESDDNNLGKKIVEQLKTVLDPEASLDVVSMGLIHELEVEAGNVSLVFKPTVPTCPFGLEIASEIKKAVRSVEGVKNLKITVVEHKDSDTLNIQLCD